MMAILPETAEENMLKRLSIAIIAALLLVAAGPMARATAMGITVVTKCPPPQLTFDPIQSGLWAGVNLDPNGIFTSTGTEVIVTENGTFCSVPEGTDAAPDFNASVEAVNNANSPSTSSNTSMSTSQTSSSSSTSSTSMSSMSSQTSQTFSLPSQASSTGGSYVAMGDSVAAGVGLPGLIPASPGQFGCDVTAEAYPFMVASNLNLPVRNVACSGATVASMFATPSGPFGNAPQLSLAFASGVPKVISITAGANDAEWSKLANDCFFSNCATMAETNRANADLVNLQKNFMGLLAAIKSKSSNNPPQVVVTGYYNPISLRCTTLSSNITADEVNWMTGEVNALNETIEGVVNANSSFARFVPIDFTGHDICSNSPWVQGLTSPRPFHPTITGQQVIASNVENAINL